MSWRSSLSMKPSLFWSIMLKASLNSWIWDWSNIANTLEVARWGRFLVFFPLALLLDILAVDGSPSPVTHKQDLQLRFKTDTSVYYYCWMRQWGLRVSGLITVIWSHDLIPQTGCIIPGLWSCLQNNSASSFSNQWESLNTHEGVFCCGCGLASLDYVMK